MPFLRPSAVGEIALAKPNSASFGLRHAAREHGIRLVALARRNGIFAVSEICKGLVILGVGDIATAEYLGDFVGVTAQTFHSLADANPLHPAHQCGSSRRGVLSLFRTTETSRRGSHA
jgi:hypothetical protein